jgi:hypothetical protein
MSETPLRRNRDFLLFQGGQLLSTFGSGLSSIAQAGIRAFDPISWSRLSTA